MSLLATLSIMLLCILLEAFFSGSEIAVVSVNRAHLKFLVDKGSKKAKAINEMLSNPEWLLGTTLLGTNFSTITLNVVATLFVIEHFGSQYEFLTILVTAPLVLFFGEVLPKALFQYFADKIALELIFPLRFFSWLFSPFIFTTSKLVTLISRAFGVHKNKRTPLINREELELLFQASEQSETGLAKSMEKQMIDRVFHFSEKICKDIMIPLVDMVSISENSTLMQAKKTLTEHGHSRIPVYRKRIDNIVGWLTHHDLLNLENQHSLITKIMRKPFYIPDNISIDKLLIDMQKQGINLAMVVDEYGGVIGMITMEDILEEIIGDIEDEHDESQNYVFDIGSDSLLVSARISIEELNQLLSTPIPEGEYETLGGYLIQKFRRIPNQGASIQSKSMRFIVEEATEKSIETIKIVSRSGQNVHKR
ncbi:MAG TPA: hemolysin family protein [Oligoflexia bacterium]|nr:hemolysin family protein [Oligoflexia bacterium]HMR25680.1 hemolysin family protein [Oligoflexia bacterium]